MPELSQCCGAKTYSLYVKSGLTSRAENYRSKKNFKLAGYFCLKCGKVHLNQQCQRYLQSMITVYNKRLAKREQRPIAAVAKHG